MFFNDTEAVRAEVAYRQAKIGEQYRRANSRKNRRTARPKHSRRG
jgi:hypothetical protein